MVNFKTESVAGIHRNRWQVWTGLPGRFEAESTQAEEVDHVKPVSQYPELRLVYENLQNLLH